MSRQRGIALVFVLILSATPPAVAAQSSRAFAWETTVQADTDAKMLRWPVAIASGAEDELAVIDIRGSRLVVFKLDGIAWKHERAISLPGFPVDIAHDGQRYLVSLRGDRRLMSVEGAHHQRRDIPVPDGVVPGAVSGMPGGGFLFHDLAAGRVYRLPPGERPTQFAAVDGPVTAMVAAPGGGFYVALPNHAALARYGANGDLIDQFELSAGGPVPVWPSGLAVAPGGDIIVVDRHAGRLLVVDAAGNVTGIGSRQGSGPGLLRFPGGLTRMRDGRVAVADEGNGRVQIFRSVAAEAQP